MLNYRALEQVLRRGAISIFLLCVFFPGGTLGQTSFTTQKFNRSLGGPIANHPQPIETGRVSGSDATSPWTETFAGFYDFSDQRSRVGDVSLDFSTGGIDYGLFFLQAPFTSIDFSYAHAYAHGSSATGSTQTWNQDAFSLTLLQPLNQWFASPPSVKTWMPATLNFDTITSQVAVLLDGTYVYSNILEHAPRLNTSTSIAQTFTGDALLDYQLGLFKSRLGDTSWCDSFWSTKGDPAPLSADYPSLLFESASGLQFSITRLHSSAASTGSQLTYRSFARVVCSSEWKIGIVVSAECDSPLDSRPFHGSQSYYATTATFSAGIVYNYFAGRRPVPRYKNWSFEQFSASVLYSYTAFDPFTETNQVQVRFSYSF